MEEIKVTIKKDGIIEMECEGFVGTACNVTRVAEEALGLVSETTDKDEMYKNEIQLNEFDTN